MSSATKKKKSFTLTPSSIVFLERLKRERKGASVSLILDRPSRPDSDRSRVGLILRAVAHRMGDVCRCDAFINVNFTRTSAPRRT
jgi:hypothetical protein